MADTLRIQDVEVACRLGVQEWEQAAPQTIWIDLDVAIDAARAAARDDVREAVDYGRVVTAIKALAQQQPYRLMETLAEAVAQRILQEFQTPRVVVAVKKRALPGIGYAAVEVVRSRVGKRRPNGRFPRAAPMSPAGPARRRS